MTSTHQKTNGVETDLQYARIAGALAPFGLTEGQRQKAAYAIAKQLGHFHAHDDFTESKAYLDFHGKAQQLVARFKEYGLTMEKWTRACLVKPALFPQSAENTEAKIRGVVERFAAEGLTLEAYLEKPYLEPSRFVESPERIEANIRTIGHRFASQGITTEAYLNAAIAHPQLFVRAPDTITDRLNLYFTLQDEGLLQINWRNKDKTPRENLVHMLLTEPSLLCGKEAWLLQRLALALVSGKPLSRGQLSHANPEIEAKLSNYIDGVGHILRDVKRVDDLPASTPRNLIGADSVEYGEMLLVDLAKRGELTPDLNAKVLCKTQGRL